MSRSFDARTMCYKIYSNDSRNSPKMSDLTHYLTHILEECLFNSTLRESHKN